jgi:nucleoside-diphosphate-sugar epimerase
MPRRLASWFTSTTRARTDLGYEPAVDREEGMRRTITQGQ